jgi:hypothetical protein
MIRWSTVGHTLLVARYTEERESGKGTAEKDVKTKIAAFDLVEHVLAALERRIL